MPCYDTSGNPRWVLGAIEYLRNYVGALGTSAITNDLNNPGTAWGVACVPDVATALAGGLAPVNNEEDLFLAQSHDGPAGVFRYYEVAALAIAAFGGATLNFPLLLQNCNEVINGSVVFGPYGAVTPGALLGAPSVGIATLPCSVGVGCSFDACGLAGNMTVIQIPQLILQTVCGVYVPGETGEYAPEYVIGLGLWYPATSTGEGAHAANGWSAAPQSWRYGQNLQTPTPSGQGAFRHVRGNRGK